MRERIALFGLALFAALAAAQSQQRSFESPESLAEAFVGALEADDRAALAALLGPDGEELLDSGDAVQDAVQRREFVAAYRARHLLAAETENQRTLLVGEEEWPFPVPIVQHDAQWLFDAPAGVDELIYRRIGANELGAIAVCRGFVDAQNEYAATGRDGDPPGIYALKLLSDEGRQNGLYWPTTEQEPESPAGPLVAAAAAEGYRSGSATYHGYRYRMLYRQGSSAAGAAREYFNNGLLTEGFALVAWPAEYGVSGIMTFIVNQDGVVFENDLGEATETSVAALTAFDPDSSWRAVD